MADTVDMTAGTSSSICGGGVKIANFVDLQDANTANTIATAGALATTDIIQCLDIPAGMLVKNVFIKIVRAATATTLTCSVGHGGAAASWNANTTDLDAVVGTLAYGVVDSDAFATAQGFLYTGADTIDITLNTVTAVTAWPKILVTADCFDPTSG